MFAIENRAAFAALSGILPVTAQETAQHMHTFLLIVPGLSANPAASVRVTEDGALDPSPHRVVDLRPVAAVYTHKSSGRIGHGAVGKRADDCGAQTGCVSDGGVSLIAGVDDTVDTAAYLLKLLIVDCGLL